MSIEARRLLAIEPDEQTLRHLREVVGRPIILVTDARRACTAIAALHVARTYLGCHSRVVCMVDDASEAATLRRQINELALPGAHVFVPTHDAERAACIGAASALFGDEALAAAFGLAPVAVDSIAAPTIVARAFAGTL